MAALLNKVAIVTGASSGIGRATARLFAREGARVIVTDRRSAELNALVSEIGAAGGAAVAVPGDVRLESHAEALVDRAIDRFGGLDIGFNNAGAIGRMAPISDVSLEQWRDTLDTNLEIARSALYLASDASLFTTGAALLVDGGLSISRR